MLGALPLADLELAAFSGKLLRICPPTTGNLFPYKGVVSIRAYTASSGIRSYTGRAAVVKYTSTATLGPCYG